MFDSKITGNKNTGTLTLKGDLTIQHIDNIKKALLDIISRSKKIVVRIDVLEKIDFSCFQALCAAHKSAEKQKKTMVVTPPPGDVFLQNMEYAGFARRIEDNTYETRGFIVNTMVDAGVDTRVDTMVNSMEKGGKA